MAKKAHVNIYLWLGACTGLLGFWPILAHPLSQGVSGSKIELKYDPSQKTLELA